MMLLDASCYGECLNQDLITFWTLVMEVHLHSKRHVLDHSWLPAAYQGPSGETYTGEEDSPPGHTTLKGEMLPSSNGATVYGSFFDVSAGKFKPWEAIMDTTAIPQAAEVLPRRALYYLLEIRPGAATFHECSVTQQLC